MSNEMEFFNQINSETDMFEKLSKYITPNELNQLAKKQEDLIFFHLIFLYYHITSQSFIIFYASPDVKFDVIGITGSKLNRNKKHLATINLPNYSREHCPAMGQTEEHFCIEKKYLSVS